MVIPFSSSLKGLWHLAGPPFLSWNMSSRTMPLLITLTDSWAESALFESALSGSASTLSFWSTIFVASSAAASVSAASHSAASTSAFRSSSEVGLFSAVKFRPVPRSNAEASLALNSSSLVIVSSANCELPNSFLSTCLHFEFWSLIEQCGVGV